MKEIDNWKVWRYQNDNQIPLIEEQTTQWQKEKVQKAKQRSTKHTHKTKDGVTRTPLNISDYNCISIKLYLYWTPLICLDIYLPI
jgi:hypothetical protein